MENKKSDLSPLMGLWKNVSKNNEEFFSGKLTPKVKILIFKNKNKRPDSHDPDFNVFYAPIKTIYDPFTKKEKEKEDEDVPF